jgi:hypothetical protein
VTQETTPIPIEQAPRDGRLVTLFRSDGTSLRARWGAMPHSIFRDPDEEQWLTEYGKFATVPFAQAVGWLP